MNEILTMQHKFKINEREFLAVGVPSEEYSIYKNQLFSPVYRYICDLPKKSKLLFMYPNCTEEEAALVVEPFWHPNPKHTFDGNSRIIGYENYIITSEYTNTALESLASLMEREKAKQRVNDKYLILEIKPCQK